MLDKVTAVLHVLLIIFAGAFLCWLITALIAAAIFSVIIALYGLMAMSSRQAALLIYVPLGAAVFGGLIAGIALLRSYFSETKN